MFGVLDFVGRDFIQRLLRRKVFWEKDIAFVPLLRAQYQKRPGAMPANGKDLRLAWIKGADDLVVIGH